MLLDELERIASEENADLHVSEEKVSIEDGASSPHVVIIFTINYKGRKIILRNLTGTNFYGRVRCEIGNSRDSLEFRLTTISNFANLFLRKDKFKIHKASPNIQSFLRQSVGMMEMRKIAMDTVFEPTIIGNNENGKYILITEYSLQFSNWTQAIKPILKFYREFIEQFAERNANKELS